MTLPHDLDPDERTLLSGLEADVSRLADAHVQDATLDAVTRARILARVRRETAAAPDARARLRPALVVLPFAAAVIALLMLPRLAGWPAAPPPLPDLVAAPVPPAPTAPPAGATSDTAAQTFVWVLAFAKPAVHLSPAALTWRGSGAPESFIEAIKPGVDAYRSDRYTEVEQHLLPLRTTYPRAIEVPFFIGLSRMLRGDMPGALEPLEAAAALADGTTGFEVEVAWYRAVALERSGRDNDARQQLLTLCRGNSVFKRDACRGAVTLGGSGR